MLSIVKFLSLCVLSLSSVANHFYYDTQSVFTALQVPKAELCNEIVILSDDKKVLIKYIGNEFDKSYTIPQSVEIIDAYAFSNCDLEQIIFPNIWAYNKKMIIGSNAFSQSSNLRYLYLPYYIESLGESVFVDCSPDMVFIVGKDTPSYKYVLGNHINKKSRINIIQDELSVSSWIMSASELFFYPDEIECDDYRVVDHVLFFGSSLIAYPLKNMNIEYNLPNFVEDISASVFLNPNLERVHLNDRLRNIQSFAQQSNGRLNYIDVESSNPYFATQNGVLYSADMRRLLCYPALRETFIFVIPREVEYLEDECFSNCHITHLVLPLGLKYIGSFVFWNAKIMSLNIPDTVSELDITSFENCPYLKTIYIYQDSYSMEFFIANKDYVDFTDLFTFLPSMLNKDRNCI